MFHLEGIEGAKHGRLDQLLADGAAFFVLGCSG